jgi:DNA-binding transcriptional LysR family regulator
VRLNQIRDLIAAVEAGSLRAAARRIGVSQPAMTKSLRQLEQELHSQLLLRTARGVVLTPAGRAFIIRARVIQTELRKAEEDLAALRGGAEGVVSFGVAGVSTIVLVPGAMARFRLKHPQTYVHILEGSRNSVIPLVRDETLDFAVAQGATGPIETGITFKPLFRPELVVAGRRGHPLAAARSLRDLTDASWLVFYPPASGGILERVFGAADIPPPKAAVHCESYAAALALIARSDLLGLLLGRIFDEPYANRFLQRINIKEEMPAPTIGMFVRAGTPLAPAAGAMAQAVTAVARALARPA